MSEFHGDIGDPISSFEMYETVIEIEDFGNGIFRISPSAGEKLDDDNICHELLARSLAWWRKETKAEIISVVGFDGNDTLTPSLLIVTEISE